MKVIVLRSFVGSASVGAPMEMPKGADWVKAGLCRKARADKIITPKKKK